MILPKSRPSKNKRMPYRIIDREGILVNPDKGNVIHLNETAAEIWKAIDGKHTVEELVEQVCDVFDVDEQIARKDVAEFLKELVENNAIDFGAQE